MATDITKDLATVCRPVLKRICEYWLLKRSGLEPSAAQALDQVSADLASVRRRAAEDPALSEAFARIEQPLIFFIDYTIKEGGFTFSADWRELARDFGELSGDEKFFELLEDCRHAPDAGERLSVFFLLLGLGFDGIYRTERWRTVEIMQSIAGAAPQGFNPATDLITPPPKAKETTKKQQHAWLSHPAFAIGCCALVLVAAFAWNGWKLHKATEDFRNEVIRAVFSAAPQLSILTEDELEDLNEYSTRMESESADFVSVTPSPGTNTETERNAAGEPAAAPASGSDGWVELGAEPSGTQSPKGGR